jgi:hypothetical protein
MIIQAVQLPHAVQCRQLVAGEVSLRTKANFVSNNNARDYVDDAAYFPLSNARHTVKVHAPATHSLGLVKDVVAARLHCLPKQPFQHLHSR